jgi:hypothetical protein
MGRISNKAKQNIDPIMVKAALEYVFEKKLTGRQGEEFLKPYMGFKSGAVKSAVEFICPEMTEAHYKWLKERQSSPNHRERIKTDKRPDVETDIAHKAFLGYHFDNYTNEDIIKKLTSKK